jgi:hypothetical protein
MSNQSGTQNNPQLAGSNIVGVNPGDAQQKDAQALQRASQAAGTANAGMGAAGMMNAGMGAAGMTTAGMGAGSTAGYGATNSLGLGATSMAGSSGAQSNNPQLAGANIVGVNPGNAQQKDAQALQRASQAAGGLGAATSSTGYGGMGAATSMAGSSGAQSNNPQLAGANIVGVNPGDAQQKDAQAMQRLGQSGGAPQA